MSIVGNSVDPTVRTESIPSAVLNAIGIVPSLFDRRGVGGPFLCAPIPEPRIQTFGGRNRSPIRGPSTGIRLIGRWRRSSGWPRSRKTRPGRRENSVYPGRDSGLGRDRAEAAATSMDRSGCRSHAGIGRGVSERWKGTPGARTNEWSPRPVDSGRRASAPAVGDNGRREGVGQMGSAGQVRSRR